MSVSLSLSPKNILVIPLRFIGDTVLTVPLLRNIQRAWPQANVDVLVSRVTAPLLEPCPYIRQCVAETSAEFPKPFLRRTFQQIQQGQYDLVFLLRKSVSMAMLCQWAGAKYVVGYDKQRWFAPLHYQRWGLCLDQSVAYPSLRTETPQARSHLSLLEALNKPIMDDFLELWTTPSDEARIQQLLVEENVPMDSPWVGLHLTAASHGKAIPIEKFIPTLQGLHQQGIPILCTGMPGDRKAYDTLAQQLNAPLINLAGKTSLRETVALYKRLHTLLSVDSSPIHLAAAAGTPNIVGLFGPTNEKQWGHAHSDRLNFQAIYQDLPCRPCYAKICEHNRCRMEMDPQAICQAILNTVQYTVPGTV